MLDAYIYYSEKDLYISQDSRYLNEEVYNLSFQYQDMDYKTWSELAGGRYYDAMLPQREVAFQDSKGMRQVITYFQSFPVNNAKVKGNINHYAGRRSAGGSCLMNINSRGMAAPLSTKSKIK